MIRLQRVYDTGEMEGHAYKILIDRLWPRGIRKSALNMDEWMKEVAPSTDLRKWFGHDPAKWKEFRQAYTKELRENKVLLRKIKVFEAEYGTVVLLLAAKDPIHNHGLVLKEVLDTFL